MSESDTAESGEAKQDIRWVAIGPHAHGNAERKEEAVKNMVPHLPSRVREADTIPIGLYKVRGLEGISKLNGAISAEEMLAREEAQLDGAMVRRVHELLGDLDRAVEDLVVTVEEAVEAEEASA